MLPNFLVVGAAKCGTSSLFHYLNQHPDVYIPAKKECLFFSELEHFNGPRNDQEINAAIVRSVDDYQALFEGATNQRMRGDVSHDYLYYHERAIPNILKHVGSDLPIIIILRDPRKRAFSHYKHHLKAGTSSDTSFQQALAKEAERIEQGWSWNWHYVKLGLYADQVKAYIENFTNVRVYLFDDLIKDPQWLVRDLYEFIGVDPAFVPDMGVENAGVSIRNNQMNRFLKHESRTKEFISRILKTMGFTQAQITRLKRTAITANTGAKAEIDTKTLKYLTNIFKSDIERLEKLTQFDLSSWLQESNVAVRLSGDLEVK